MAWWSDVTATIWRLLDEHGQLTAFVLLFLEEAGVPPLIPGDFLMILVGVQVAAGRLNLLEAMLVLELATILGGTVLYAAAAWGGQDLVYRLGRYVGATPARLDAAAASLERHGERAVTLGRFVPGLSNLTTIACGVLGFPYRRFLPALAIGGFLRMLAFVLLGYVFGPPMLAVAERLHLPVELLASLAVFLGLGIWVIRAARAERNDPVDRMTVADRLHDGVLAGLFGAVESTLLVNVLIHIFGLINYERPIEALGSSGLLGLKAAPTLVVLIAPAFLILPTIWGAIYGIWGSDVMPGPCWLRGLFFSLVPLVVSWLVILPIAGAGPFGLDIGFGLIPALGEAVRHLAWGLTVGVTFFALSRSQRPIRGTAPSPHPA